MRVRTEVNTRRLTTDLNVLEVAKLYSVPVQTIAMADATVTLVLDAAGEGQVRLTGQALLVDAQSGGASEILKLPAAAGLTGVVLTIFNTGGEGIAVQTSDGSAITTIAAGKAAVIGCNGAGFGVLSGA